LAAGDAADSARPRLSWGGSFVEKKIKPRGGPGAAYFLDSAEYPASLRRDDDAGRYPLARQGKAYLLPWSILRLSSLFAHIATLGVSPLRPSGRWAVSFGPRVLHVDGLRDVCLAGIGRRQTGQDRVCGADRLMAVPARIDRNSGVVSLHLRQPGLSTASPVVCWYWACQASS